MTMLTMIAAMLLTGASPAPAVDPDALCQITTMAALAMYEHDQTMEPAHKAERIKLFEGAAMFFNGILAERYRNADLRSVEIAANAAYRAMSNDDRANKAGECIGVFAQGMGKIAGVK
jgi:hypothetical protein